MRGLSLAIPLTKAEKGLSLRAETAAFVNEVRTYIRTDNGSIIPADAH